VPDFETASLSRRKARAVFRLVVEQLDLLGPRDGRPAMALLRYFDRWIESGRRLGGEDEEAFMRALYHVGADPERTIVRLEKLFRQQSRDLTIFSTLNVECIILLELMQRPECTESEAVLNNFPQHNSIVPRTLRNERLKQCRNLGERAIASLLDDLNSDEDPIRLSAVDSLLAHKLHVEECMQVLRDVANSDSFDTVRHAALIVIDNKIPAKFILPALRRRDYVQFSELDQMLAEYLARRIETNE